MMNKSLITIDESYDVATNVREISESNRRIDKIQTYSELAEWFGDKDGKSVFIFEEGATIRPQDQRDGERSNAFWRLAAKANENGLPIAEIAPIANFSSAYVNQEIRKVRNDKQ